MRRACYALLGALGVLAAGSTGAAAQLPAGLATASPNPPVLRHSPLFGLGPQTIYRGGWGIEIEGEWERMDGGVESERGLHADIHYGVTEDLTVSLSVPLVQKTEREGVLSPGLQQVVRDVTGVGEILVRGKYRFWQDLFPSGNHQATLFGGVKLPTGRTTTEPPLGTGSVDFLTGAAISRETHWYYTWASVLGRLNTRDGGRRRGHELRYDLAVGVRPYVPQWTDPDLMLLLELVGVTAAQSVGPAGENPNTGGTVLAVAPGMWLTYRNWALKAGVKLPFHQALNGTQPDLDFQTVFALEYHFGG